MQVLNVAFGGTLLQHLPDAFGHDGPPPRPGTFDGSDHDVRLAPGSLAALAAGSTLHTTKSHHHQGVDRTRRRPRCDRLSTIDDLPEAIEVPGDGSCSASSGTRRPTSAAG